MFTATHSVMSTYFGSITMVLKFPFTRAESAKGLHKYRGLEMAPSSLDAEPREFVRERVPELGVGERLGLLGALFLFPKNDIFLAEWI